MKITVDWLNEKSACSQGVEWFKTCKKSDPLGVLNALIRADKLQWANWLICRLMDKPNQVRYAIFAAFEVIHLFEKKYPKDKRPRKAIEAAQAWLDNPNDKTKSAAAYAAAAAAAYAAAYAAAAYAAEAAAADADARKKLQLKILEYGMGLLNAGRKDGGEK